MTRKEYLKNLDEMKEKIINSGSMIDVLQISYNYALQEQTDRHLGAVPYERSSGRRGFRNGTRDRKMRTLIGELALKVPQVRGIAPMPIPFERYQQIDRSVIIACYELYFKRVSNRKVSRIIEEEFIYLLVAREGKVGDVCAYFVCGFTEDGRREVLDVAGVVPESVQTWIAVFHRLKQCGLHEIRLLISEGYNGIQSALAEVLDAFLPNAIRKVPRKHQTKLFADLKVLRNTPDNELTASNSTTTSNSMERIMRETKRHTRVIGVFPNTNSALRIVGSVILRM